MILDKIVQAKRAEIDKRRARVSLAEFERRALTAPPPRDLAGALRRAGLVALIAEIKPASPSRGELRAHVDPLRIAEIYENNGAAAISVLTDRPFFKGGLNNLKAARVASTAPVLRKDFIIDPYQIFESRALQADAILLIARLLSDNSLRTFCELTTSLGMAALVEVHTAQELERACLAGAALVGINNRNLADFTTDLATTEALAPLVPRDRLIVSESGITSRDDVARAARAGAHAVLVGEALMRAEDIGARVRDLASVRRPQE